MAVGDRDTVFGDLNTESEDLPPEYRSHGGFVEARVPLVAFNADAAPAADSFRYTPGFGPLAI